jgi:hypothetical protein
MAAPEGNQFWKLRSKHGRDKLFESPELLWEAACEYFQWCSENPWNRVDFKGKDADRVGIPTERPLTINGLCLYLRCTPDYFKAFKNQDRANKEDFIPVINEIEQTIYTQKFEGAAVGAFNANIIARDLGLADKKDVQKTVTRLKFTDAAG